MSFYTELKKSCLKNTSISTKSCLFLYIAKTVVISEPVLPMNQRFFNVFLKKLSLLFI